MIETDANKSLALQTLQMIRAACESALSEGVACLAITIRRENPPTGDTIRLCTHSGPRGELLNAVPCGTGEEFHWQATARFRCATVILWASKTIELILKNG